ncbi:MAG: DUF465 domain-containing protein [Alphaproteobacteria bacterium]|nr:DUF465 domain-containing protein [Alphaproteobacteria bacterium]MDP6819424.1 DUF465 domain-containing protein [Alphaproteobacteria bacterium]
MARGVWRSAAVRYSRKKFAAMGTMYSKLDPVDISNDLLLDDYVASLAAKHANLEKAIQDEAQRPAPNTLSLAELKRRKLRVKDQIFLVKARIRGHERRSRA